MMNPCLREHALQLLCLSDPSEKARQTRDLFASMAQFNIHPAAQLLATENLPGRPALPRLVSPKEVPTRSAFTVEGRAALLHAIAHIEFNAINLALDAVWRFADMPLNYYRDWLRVASEEALHFSLLREHLLSTAHDVLARMALVPRTLEARGLDATPPLQAKFAKAGDPRAVEILGVILRDEVGHVAIGNHWYRWLCERQGLDPVAHYAVLAFQHNAPRSRPPYNIEARLAAGFSEDEIARLI
jgi:uncharacterized ferritin-like protein (DUF455 family)